MRRAENDWGDGTSGCDRLTKGGGSGDDGYGDGSGSGYGYDYDHGCGYCHGSGNGGPLGFGRGEGDISDIDIGTINGFSVRVNPHFGLVAIGCQVHTLDTWRRRWSAIARAGGLKEREIKEIQADEILTWLEGVCNTAQESG